MSLHVFKIKSVYLYAIAYLTTFCEQRKLTFDMIFDSNKMRQHILQCFDNRLMTEFPICEKKVYSKQKLCKTFKIDT